LVHLFGLRPEEILHDTRKAQKEKMAKGTKEDGALSRKTYGIQFNPVTLKKRYRELGSIRKVAKAYGVDYKTIWNHLVWHGIEINPPGNPGLNGRWSLDWPRCRDCGTTDKEHDARGLCTRCYRRHLYSYHQGKPTPFFGPREKE